MFVSPRLRSRIRNTILGIAAFSLLAGATNAMAAPISVTLGLVTPDSELNISVSALGGTITGSQTIGVSGSATVWLDWIDDPVFGALPTLLGFHDADLSLGPFDISLPIDPLTTIKAESTVLGASLSGPHVSGIAPGPNSNVFDVGGTTFSIDDGLVSFVPPPLVPIVPVEIDFSTSPLDFELPVGSTVSVIEEVVVPGQKANVTVTIPISIVQSIITSPIDVNAVLDGLLVATGMKNIPEPAAVVLMLLGVIGMLPLVRRLRCR